jgi:hypothetical protein
VLAPDGSTIYLASALLGEYEKSQMNETGPQGIPTICPPFPKRLGAFQHEPIIWAGHSVLNEANEGRVPARTDAVWSKSCTKTVFKCEHSLFEYSVRFSFFPENQNTTVLPNKKFLRQIQNTTLENNVKGPKNQMPTENFVYPKDISQYRLLAAHHSIRVKLRETINGSITVNSHSVPIVLTEAINTKLISFDPYLPVSNLKENIQSLYEDILLSLLSRPELVVVKNATDSSRQGDQEHGYRCIKTRLRNVFNYHRVQMLLSYGFFLILTWLAVAFGARAQRWNEGQFKDNKFSSIMAATRGSQLDSLDWKLDSWGHISLGLEKSKMIYTADVCKGLGTGQDIREGFCKVD